LKQTQIKSKSKISIANQSNASQEIPNEYLMELLMNLSLKLEDERWERAYKIQFDHVINFNIKTSRHQVQIHLYKRSNLFFSVDVKSVGRREGERM